MTAPASGPESTAAIGKIAFVSLGCPKNLVDSEQMLGSLLGEGFELVADHDDADAIIINTCGFLEASKQESIQEIREAIQRKNSGAVKRVVVTGCLVQRHRAKLLEWAPGIDAMIGVFDRDHVLEAVRGLRCSAMPLAPGSAGGTNGDQLPRYWIASNALQAAKQRGLNTIGLTVNGGPRGRGVGYFEDDSNRFRLTPRHFAYLRISEGCNQRCAFCTIPSIRGKMRSKPLDRVIAEARQLFADGAFELNLIGQDTTSYGYDIYRRPDFSQAANVEGYPGDLIGLLTALNDVASECNGPTGGWVRLMYVYPTHFTDEMIDAIARLPNIVKYIDIPLQHISDSLLTSMRRNISRAQQETLLHKLRERIPGLAIRTTFITGFPGETDDDHRELLEFIEEFQFDMLGVFKYSHEDGTPAGTMDLDPALHVPDEVKSQREQEIMLLQQRIAFDNAAYVAQQRCEFDVLIDRVEKPGAAAVDPRGHDAARSSAQMNRFAGRCYHQAPQVDSVTYVESSQPLAAGQLVRCTIVDSEGYDLIARPSAELQ